MMGFTCFYYCLALLSNLDAINQHKTIHSWYSNKLIKTNMWNKVKGQRFRSY